MILSAPDRLSAESKFKTYEVSSNKPIVAAAFIIEYSPETT